MRHILSLVILTLLTTVSQAQDISSLPIGARRLIDDEQNRLLKGWDSAESTYKDHSSQQDQRYTPQERNIFKVKSYWVNAKDWHAFKVASIPLELRNMFIKTLPNGKVQYRLLVHPESESFFKDIVSKATRAENFFSTATSSSRTLVTWQEGLESRPFFAKLSLDAVIGNWRIIRPAEIARSIGTTILLDHLNTKSPLPFKYFPEVFGLTPKGANAGGMIIRSIPKNVLSGNTIVRPIFALFAEGPNGEKPEFVKMINKSGLSAEDFFREYIIDPWVKNWVDLVSTKGINFEDHSQNLLIEIDKKTGLPSKIFWRRDFGGFSLDLKFMRMLKLLFRRLLPNIRGEYKDYSQADILIRIQRVLRIHFAGGIVFNIDRLVPRWMESKWIDSSPWKVRHMNDVYLESLAENLGDRLGRTVDTSSDRNITRAILKLKKQTLSKKSIKQSLINIFKRKNTTRRINLCKRIFVL